MLPFLGVHPATRRAPTPPPATPVAPSTTPATPSPRSSGAARVRWCSPRGAPSPTPRPGRRGGGPPRGAPRRRDRPPRGGRRGRGRGPPGRDGPPPGGRPPGPGRPARARAVLAGTPTPTTVVSVARPTTRRARPAPGRARRRAGASRPVPCCTPMPCRPRRGSTCPPPRRGPPACRWRPQDGRSRAWAPWWCGRPRPSPRWCGGGARSASGARHHAVAAIVGFGVAAAWWPSAGRPGGAGRGAARPAGLGPAQRVGASRARRDGDGGRARARPVPRRPGTSRWLGWPPTRSCSCSTRRAWPPPARRRAPAGATEASPVLAAWACCRRAAPCASPWAGRRTDAEVDVAAAVPRAVDAGDGAPEPVP